MTDIRYQSDSELSMLVYNTDYLYQLRHGSGFLRLIDKLFVYRPAQLKVLLHDLQAETDNKSPYGDNV